MKKVLLVASAATILFSGSAFAIENYGKFTGKCAQKAVTAAVSFWADVPNPSDDLEYQPVSAMPVAARSNVYNVVLAFGAQGDFLGTSTYQVTFADYAGCSQVKVIDLPSKH